MLFSNRDLKKLLLPLVIEQILVMLVGMVDTVMVSSVGAAAVSGVALVDMVNFLVITVLTALTTGGSVILSQYLGNRQPDKAAVSAGQLMTVSALSSAGIMAVCVLLRVPILHLFFGAVEPDVMDAALTYFLVTACSFPFLGVYNAAAAQFRSMGRTSMTMYVSLMIRSISREILSGYPCSMPECWGWRSLRWSPGGWRRWPCRGWLFKRKIRSVCRGGTF